MFRDQYPVSWTFHRNTAFGLASPRSSSGQDLGVPPFKEYLSAPTYALPVAQPLDSGVVTCISARRSCRQFADTCLPVAQLARVLWYAYGVLQVFESGVHEVVQRPVPSAGSLYPLELYAIVLRVEGLAPRLYHYAADNHLLEQVRPEEMSELVLSGLFLDQAWVTSAAAIVVVTAIPQRCLWKYGERGYRYILLEAGHVSQNVQLVATEAGLGSTSVGAFHDLALAEFLELDDELEFPVYAVALGVPPRTDEV